MDTIAAAAFGVDAQSFTNPKSEFVKYARTVFRNAPVDMVKIIIAFLPFGANLLDFLGIAIFKPKATKFFVEVIENTIKARKSSESQRKDLIDLMINALKENGEVCFYKRQKAV